MSIFFGLWGKKKDGYDEVEKFFEIKEEGGLKWEVRDQVPEKKRLVGGIFGEGVGPGNTGAGEEFYCVFWGSSNFGAKKAILPN